MKLSFIRLNRRRSLGLLGAAGMAAAAVGVLPAPAQAAPVPFASAAWSGSASGESVHVDALGNAISVDVARSSTAVNSKGLTAATDPATHHAINPASSKNAYAYGKGLEALGSVAIADEAEATAPPTGPTVLNDVQVPVSPLVYASLSRGVATARYNPETCILGSDISTGVGYVADAQLIGDGTQADPNLGLTNPLVSLDTGSSRDVVQTTTRQTMVPNSDGSWGLKSTVATILVPVKLGIPGLDLTLEVAGDWILSATASGIAGQSKVEYKPADVPDSPTTPVIRLLQGTDVLGGLNLQDLLGGAGLTIPVSPLINVTIGTPPTQSISADGTTVSASADVASVELLPGAPGAPAMGANIRVGHAQVKAQVPAGGINCPIPVSKKATPSIVNAQTAPDGKFVVEIAIKNGFDCDLTGVTATDEIVRKSGNVTFAIEENDSRNDPKKGAGATFKKNSATSSTASYTLGTIKAGETRTIKVVQSVASGNGEIQDTATAKGTLACPQGSAIGNASVNLNGSFTLITTVSRVLARTGGEETAALLAGALAVSALLTRRIVRTRRTA